LYRARLRMEKYQNFAGKKPVTFDRFYLSNPEKMAKVLRNLATFANSFYATIATLSDSFDGCAVVGV
jgi:hypothetical protein